ncbi:hypothetical protein [Dyella jiangningensis]|uniref:Uncharacterized protein n=1 Tax=Dyella jiangningensis TaxID=1379159 RepID=A0A328P370_9GAMM|nr:hypothetical protein [Dyella jiangningensis]RAO75711.1 hypothetical protein CA260_16835 [Dyella jiangningensis]
MANDLAVTLNESTNPWLVDVDQKNNANHVARSNQTQTITWQLNGNAASGKIVSCNWVNNPPATNPPPAGIFGPFVIAPNGKSMTITDLNNSTSTTGDWIYQISVQLVDNGPIYQSGYVSITGTATNPTIKNN